MRGETRVLKSAALAVVFVILVVLGTFLVTRNAPDELPPDAVYIVAGDSITLSSGTEADWHAIAWNRWIELVPANRRGLVAEFHALPYADVGGLVEASSNSLQNWSLAIGPPESAADLDNTLVHEYAHLITLGPTQMIPATSNEVADACTTYFTWEGCAREGSIIYRFVDRFWSDSDLDLASDDPDGLFAMDPEAFVTSYAATNPGEDLAETFRFFVYRNRPRGDSEAERKIDFMWDIPELVRIRTELREQL